MLTDTLIQIARRQWINAMLADLAFPRSYLTE